MRIFYLALGLFALLLGFAPPGHAGLFVPVQFPYPNPIAPDQPCIDDSDRIVNTHFFHTCGAAGSGTVTEIDQGTCIVLTPDPITMTGSVALDVSGFTLNDLLLGAGSGACPAALTAVNNAVLSDNASGVPTWLALTDGQIAIGSSIGPPLAETITAGSGISVTNGHNSITIAATGSGGTMTSVAATTSPCLTTSPAPITGAGTVVLQDPLSVPCGGTGDSTLTVHSVLLGEGTSPVDFGTVGNPGFLLTDLGGSTDPAFQAVLGNSTASPESNTVYTAPNDGSGATVLNKVVIYEFTSPNKVRSALTTDGGGGGNGICVAGCGSTGTATIAGIGFASCVFDGATTAGDFVVVSSTVNGDCHDTGTASPVGLGGVVGTVHTTNGSSGTYAITLAFPNGGGPKCSDLPFGCPYDIAFTWNGVPPSYTNCSTPTDPCINILVTRKVSCPAGFTASGGVAQEASTGTAVLNVNQIHAGTPTTRGTVTFTSSATGVVASGSGMAIAAGDVVQLAMPTSADATLGDIAVTINCSLVP